jgi:hypothetical protein
MTKLSIIIPCSEAATGVHLTLLKAQAGALSVPLTLALRLRKLGFYDIERPSQCNSIHRADVMG